MTAPQLLSRGRLLFIAQFADRFSDRIAAAGHTLTGPVLDVAVPSLVPHRDALLARWQAG